MSVSDYHIDPDLNTTISGINIAEGCPPSGINNAIRQLMADVKAEKEARDSAQNAIDDAQDKAIRDEAAARESAVSALDAAAVHKSGAETIAGAKTFAATPKIECSKPSLIFTNTALTKGTTPGADQSFVIELTDKAGSGAANRVGALANLVSTNNVARTELRAYEPVAGSSKNALLTVSFPAGGDPYGSAPSTPAGSKSNQIVTANWLAATGTYSPDTLPYYENGSTVNVSDFNLLTTPGRYHVQYAASCLNIPMAVNNSTDGILEVDMIGAASGTATSPRLRQKFHVFGGMSQPHRTFFRTYIVNSQTWKEWVEVMTSKGGTFSGAITMEASGNAYFSIQNESLPVDSSSSVSRLTGIKMQDSAGNAVGQCRTQVSSSGATNTAIITYSADGKKNGSVSVSCTADGVFVGTAPTPAADSNTTHIATTAWVRGKGVLVESWHSGANWFRRYSDGWIEQGGVTAWQANGSTGTLVPLHTPFSSTSYVPELTLNRETDEDQHWGSVGALTTTSFKVFNRWMDATDKFYWRACGY